MIDLGKWAFGHSKLVYFLLAVLLVGGLKWPTTWENSKIPKSR